MADEAMTPKSNGKKILGLLVVLALVAGAILYYGGFLGGSDEDTPPSLDLSGESGQGMLTLDGYLEVEKDEPTYTCSTGGGEDIDLPSSSTGTAVFAYPTKDISFEDLTKSIQAQDEKARVMFVYWNEAGDGTPYHARYTSSGEKNKNWYAYPGLTSLTKIAKNDLADYEIEAYHGFYIIVFDADVEVCTDDLVLQDAGLDENSVADGADFYKDNFKGKIPPAGGWVLMAANNEYILKAILTEATAAGSDFTISTAWAQKDASLAPFVKVDLKKFFNGQESLPTGYDMIWFKIVEHEVGLSYLDDYLEIEDIEVTVDNLSEITVTFNEEVKSYDPEKDFGIVHDPLPADLSKKVAAAVEEVKYGVTDDEQDKTKLVLTLDAPLGAHPEDDAETPGYKLTVENLESVDDYPINPNGNSKPFYVKDYLELVGVSGVDGSPKVLLLHFDQDLGDSAETVSNYVFNTVTIDEEENDVLGEIDAFSVDTAVFGIDNLVDDKALVKLTLTDDFPDVSDGVTVRLTMSNLVGAGGETFVVDTNHYDFVGGTTDPVVADLLELKTAATTDGATITLTFNEDVGADEAGNAANYLLYGPLDDGVSYAVSTAALVDADTKQVILAMVPALSVSGSYSVVVEKLLAADSGAALDPEKATATFEFIAPDPVVVDLGVVSVAMVENHPDQFVVIFDVAVAADTSKDSFTLAKINADGTPSYTYGTLSALVSADGMSVAAQANHNINPLTVPEITAGKTYQVSVNGVVGAGGEVLKPELYTTELLVEAAAPVVDALDFLAVSFKVLNSNYVILAFDAELDPDSIIETNFSFEVVADGEVVPDATVYEVTQAIIYVGDPAKQTISVRLNSVTPDLLDGQNYQLTFSGVRSFAGGDTDPLTIVTQVPSVL